MKVLRILSSLRFPGARQWLLCRMGRVVGAGIALLMLAGVSLSAGQPGLSPARAEDVAEVGFLPYIPRWYYPAHVPQFGFEAQVSYVWNQAWFPTRAREANLHWARVNAISWADIQPEEPNPDPVYDWDAVDNAQLLQAASNGFQIIATVKFTPYWAQKIKDTYCGPIEEEDFDDFAAFLHELVTIYSAPPYNILYYELGNEVDVSPEQAGFDWSWFGCWGDPLDSQYFGGRYYGKMLKAVYNSVKSANPKAQVLIGGLLLDCDPRYTANCTTGKFFQGILEEGAGASFDIVSFHGYSFWIDVETQPYPYNLWWDENFSKWKQSGGVVLGKVNYLRSVMDDYGISKPIFHTEVSLLYTQATQPLPARYLEDQATYLVWVFVRNWAAGIKSTIWFTLDAPGWRYGGLATWNSTRPAYQTLQFLTTELRQAIYTGLVTDYPDLKGYAFSVLGKRVWVLWSPVQQDVLITLPHKTLQVLDKYGAPITPVDDQITVNDPVFVEISY